MVNIWNIFCEVLISVIAHWHNVDKKKWPEEIPATIGTV